MCTCIRMHTYARTYLIMQVYIIYTIYAMHIGTCVYIYNCRCVNYTNCGFKLMNYQLNYAQEMNYYKKDNYIITSPCSSPVLQPVLMI